MHIPPILSVLLRLVVCLFASLIVSRTAHAGLVHAYHLDNISLTFNYSGTLGFQFTPQHDITVKELGYYDFGLDGFPSGNPLVGIWDSIGNLIVSASVSSSDRLDEVFRFASIADTVLQGGTSYVIGGHSASEPVTDSRFSSMNFNSGIVPVEARALDTAGLFFPTFETPGRAFAAASFTFEGVPEPTTLLLSGTATIGCAWLLRRLRRNGRLDGQ